MIQKIQFDVTGNWTCPAKTIAIFAHNSEFSFDEDETPSIVKLVSERCKTIHDVQTLIKEGVIPSTISG